MAVLVTNKIAATLFVKTHPKKDEEGNVLKKGETYHIPPRVRAMQLPVDSKDIIDSSPELVIAEVK